MADFDFDSKELDKYSKRILDLAQDQMPKECKKFIRAEGNKLKRATAKEMKSKVKPKTGNYHNSVARGKVYKFNGAWAVRVFSRAPHANLIEYGHRVIINGKEVGKTTGKKIFQNSAKGYESKYFKNTENFIDKIVKGI